MKGDWKRTAASKSGNIITTTGREDGKFYIRREQLNYQAVVERCARYRKMAEEGVPDPLAPLTDDGKLAHRWMDLPSVVDKKSAMTTLVACVGAQLNVIEHLRHSSIV